MKERISAFFIFLIVFGLTAQSTISCASLDFTSRTIYHTLGETQIPIKIEQYGNRSDIIYINLHHDEKTSVEATRKLLRKEGGLLIKLENKNKRNLQFRMGNRLFQVDPNRIFSLEGIRIFLRETGQYNERVALEIEKLGQRIIELLPAEAVCIVALHNNTNGFFSVNDYLPGRSRAGDALMVYTGPEQDPDNFFLTTDTLLFPHLKKQYNTILQDNKNCRQDGSLSVYCGTHGIRYVNLETEHGKTREYTEMVEYLYTILFADTLAAE